MAQLVAPLPLSYREHRPARADGDYHRPVRARSRSRERNDETQTQMHADIAKPSAPNGRTSRAEKQAKMWATLQADAEAAAAAMKCPEANNAERIAKQVALERPGRVITWMAKEGFCPACFVNHAEEVKRAAKKTSWEKDSIAMFQTVLEAPHDPTVCKGCKACAAGNCSDCLAKTMGNKSHCQCIRCHSEVYCKGSNPPLEQNTETLYRVYLPVVTAVVVPQIVPLDACKLCKAKAKLSDTSQTAACLCCANCKTGSLVTCRRRATKRAHCDELMCMECGMAITDELASSAVVVIDNAFKLPLLCGCCSANKEANNAENNAE